MPTVGLSQSANGSRGFPKWQTADPTRSGPSYSVAGFNEMVQKAREKNKTKAKLTNYVCFCSALTGCSGVPHSLSKPAAFAIPDISLCGPEWESKSSVLVPLTTQWRTSHQLRGDICTFDEWRWPREINGQLAARQADNNKFQVNVWLFAFCLRMWTGQQPQKPCIDGR